MADQQSLERAIGRIEGLVETLIKQGEESREGRARLYQAQEDVRKEVHDIKGRVEKVESTVSVMDPMVKEFDRLRQRGLGILAVLGVIWLIGGGLVMQGLGWVWGMLVRAIGGGP